MKGITKRDIKFFILGFLTFLLIETALDWSGAKQGFMDGWNRAHSEANKQ